MFIQSVKLTFASGGAGPFVASGSFASPITAGSAIIVVAGGTGQFGTGEFDVDAVEDSIAGTYTPDRYSGDAARVIGAFSYLNHPGGAATISVTNLTGFAGDCVAVAFEVANVLSSGAYDQGGDDSFSSVATGTVSLDAPTDADAEFQVAFGFFTHISGGVSISPSIVSPAYTTPYQVATGAEISGFGYSAAWRELVATTSNGVTFDVSSGNASELFALAVTYRLVAGQFTRPVADIDAGGWTVGS